MADKTKLEAFNAYDFDSNDDWKSHLRNVELPAGSAASAALQKVKAKWYKKNVDSDFDPAWIASSHSSTATGGSAAYSSQQQQQQQHSSSTTSRPPPSTSWRGASSQAGSRQALSKQLNLAILQAGVLLLALLYLQPLNRGVSAWAYKRLAMTLVILQGYKVYGANGGPAAWNTAAITAWAQRVLVTSDAHYLILAVAAYVNPPVTLLLVPYIVLAAYGLADFVSQQYGSHPIWQRYGAPLHQKMLAYYQKALQFNAQSEIMLGFQLIVGLLFPGRAPLLLMAVWQVLRLRFWSVDAAVHHRMVWAGLDQMSGRVRQQVPILQKAVTFGVNFFHAGRQ
eukprot:GHUV01016466.1.p1 GENE.GHUV01016466.1~~GHUV01016466.1.p1  ORF type:complete len:338 (+),score=109.49 GHUV01016466.1:456-1469(+)